MNPPPDHNGRRRAADGGAYVPATVSAFGTLLLLVMLLLAAPPAAQAQLLPGSGEPTPDSIATRLGLPEGHSPAGAFRRALAVPGWGQYYNRQYWKVPLAVAGLAGVVYALAYNWRQYYRYRNAWRYRRTGGQFTPPPGGIYDPDEYNGDFGGEKYEDAYREVLGQVGGQFGDELPPVVQTQRDQFRRWGETAILGTAVFWILQVADAYVSAHLLGFDVDDLSVQVLPDRQGVTTRLQLSL